MEPKRCGIRLWLTPSPRAISRTDVEPNPCSGERLERGRAARRRRCGTSRRRWRGGPAVAPRSSGRRVAGPRRVRRSGGADGVTRRRTVWASVSRPWPRRWSSRCLARVQATRGSTRSRRVAPEGRAARSRRGGARPGARCGHQPSRSRWRRVRVSMRWLMPSISRFSSVKRSGRRRAARPPAATTCRRAGRAGRGSRRSRWPRPLCSLRPAPAVPSVCPGDLDVPSSMSA